MPMIYSPTYTLKLHMFCNWNTMWWSSSCCMFHDCLCSIVLRLIQAISIPINTKMLEKRIASNIICLLISSLKTLGSDVCMKLKIVSQCCFSLLFFPRLFLSYVTFCFPLGCFTVLFLYYFLSDFALFCFYSETIDA